jgi:hypothetical protein
MRKLTTALMIAAAAFSVGAHAGSALSAVQAEAVKRTLTPEQVRVVLDNWKQNELKHIDQRARYVSDRAPKQFIVDQIEAEYRSAMKKLGV